MWLINFLSAEALLIWCAFIWYDAAEVLLKTDINHNPSIGVIVSSGMLIWLAAIFFCGSCVLEEFIES